MARTNDWSHDREGAPHSGWRRTRRQSALDRGGARHESRVRSQSSASSPRAREAAQRLSALWYTGTAHVLSENDPRARQRWLAGQLPSTAANAAAVRLFGTELLTVRIDLDD
jgi:hypothetical protein